MMPPRKPNGWTNLQDYLGVNQDQGANMASKVAGDIGAAAGGARAQIQKASSDFTTQSAAGDNSVNAFDAIHGTAEDAAKKAKQTAYTGPDGLGAVDPSLQQNVADAVQRVNNTKTAGGQQKNLAQSFGANGPTGSGGGALDSFLLSGAGGNAMSELQSQYGTLDSTYQQAAGAAGDKAAQLKADAAGNAQQWQKIADQRTAEGASDAARKQKQADSYVPPKGYEETFNGSGRVHSSVNDTEEHRQAYMMSGVDQKDPAAVARRQAEIEKYKKAMTLTTQNQMDQTFNDINTVMSPSVIVQQLGGVKDQTQEYAEGQYNKGGVASQTGSTDNNAIPWNKVGVDGFFVWRSMSPQDWQVLNSKPANGPNGQLAWIHARGEQLRNRQTPH